MDKRKGLALILMLTAMVGLAGCAHIPGGVAASNTPLEGKKYRILKPTSATDSRVLLFGIIPVTGSNSTRACLEDAIRNGGGDALIEITVDAYSQNFILFSRDVIAVEGTAIRFVE